MTGRSRHDELRAAARKNALSLLCDADGEQWLEPGEITDAAAPELIAARDVFAVLDELAAAEARVAELERGGIGREPNNAGAPPDGGYWLRRKLQAAIRHLRDVEDYYRTLGGLPVGHNMIRADRARDLYEAITEDFVNGKMTRPTRADLERDLAAQRARAEKAEQALRRIARWLLKDGAENEARKLRNIARAALAAAAAGDTGDTE